MAVTLADCAVRGVGDRPKSIANGVVNGGLARWGGLRLSKLGLGQGGVAAGGWRTDPACDGDAEEERVHALQVSVSEWFYQ